MILSGWPQKRAECVLDGARNAPYGKLPFCDKGIEIVAQGKKLIGLGDKTTTGGTVLSAHLDVQINNQGTATERCLVSCGQCGQNGMIKVLEPVGYIVHDLMVAREGDWVMCACPPGTNVLIGSPSSAIIGGTEGGLVSVFSPFAHEQAMEDAYSSLNRGLNSGSVDINELFAAASGGSVKNVPDALALPVRIYETRRQMDDYQAKDMKRGDLDAATVRGLFGIELETVSTKVNPVTLQLLNPLIAHAQSPYAIPTAPKPMPFVSKDAAASLMFDEFRELAKVFSFQGAYKAVIGELITHMQGNSGAPFSSPQLDQALKEQILSDHSDKSSLLMVRDILTPAIDYELGFIPLDKQAALFDERNNLKELSQTVLPKFDRWIDRTNGLVVSVHDTWATHITLESLEVTGNSYRARVHYRIQDHFGLDNADVLHPIYRQARLFRLWFALQRWDRFGYKPFITEMNATVEISGGRDE